MYSNAEDERLRALHGLNLLDTAPDPVLDGLVRCAAGLIGCPISLISLIDEHRQWFKARFGVELAQTSRELAFCNHALGSDALFEVPDTHDDTRFSANPLVIGAPHIRFYAGVPVRVGAHRLGTLCVAGPVPRRLDATQRRALEDLAGAVSHWLDARRERIALVENEARLADFASAGADWLWQCDARQRFTWCSDGFERANALGSESAGGHAWPDAALLDEVGEPLEPAAGLHTLMQRRERFDGVLIALDAPGGRRCLGLSGVPCFDAMGGFKAWRGSARNMAPLVAERRRAHERERVIEHTSRLVPGVIFQYCRFPDGRSSMPFASAQLAAHYEMEPEAVRHDAGAISARVHSLDRRRVIASIARSAANLTPWHLEYRVQLPQRGMRWLEGRATPERALDGSTVWHGFVTDVTERRASDAAMVESRSRHEAAEQGSRDKSAFLSRLSHELRTPLNAVLGFTQLLQIDTEQPLLPEQRERIDQVQRAGEYLLSLLNDVLEIGRIEHEGRTLERKPVGLAKVIDDCRMLVAPLAQSRAVNIELVHFDARLHVQADQRALKQVLANLLSNGVKYNRRGGTLRVNVQVRGREALIDVQDQGAGIAPERLAELFQPFNRLGAENSRVEGSGLGLVIARQLAQAMGGRIEVDSHAGAGTSFRLALPLAAGAALLVPPAVPQEPAAAGSQAPATLLYIEDDAVNALLLTEALRGQPHWRLVIARDGVQGLARARQLKPQLVLTDINLPGLTGLEVVSALRADPATRHIGCIALSADVLPEQIERALRAGCDDYWTKPLDLRKVVSRIRELLDARQPELVA